MPSEAVFLTPLVESVTPTTWRRHACTSSLVLWYRSVSMISRKKRTVTYLSDISKLLPGYHYWALTQPWHQMSWRSVFIRSFSLSSYMLPILQCASRNNFTCFPGAIEENYQDLEIDLILVQYLGTFQYPACLLNLPIHKVYMLNMYKQCRILVLQHENRNYLVAFWRSWIFLFSFWTFVIMTDHKIEVETKF